MPGCLRVPARAKRSKFSSASMSKSTPSGGALALKSRFHPQSGDRLETKLGIPDNRQGGCLKLGCCSTFPSREEASLQPTPTSKIPCVLAAFFNILRFCKNYAFFHIDNNSWNRRRFLPVSPGWLMPITGMQRRFPHSSARTVDVNCCQNSNLALASIQFGTGGVGFELAVPAKPNSKPYVERHFGTIEQDFVYSLAGTTGSNIFRERRPAAPEGSSRQFRGLPDVVPPVSD